MEWADRSLSIAAPTVVPPVGAGSRGPFAASPENTPRDSVIVQLRAQPTARAVSLRSDAGWTPMGSPLKYPMTDGSRSDQDPLKALKVRRRRPPGRASQYILRRAPNGYGHYSTSACSVSECIAGGHLSQPGARLSSTWLVVNENRMSSRGWHGSAPASATVPNVDGLIAVRLPPSG